MGNVMTKAALVAGVLVAAAALLFQCSGGGGETTTGEAPAVGGRPLGSESAAALGMEADTTDDTVRTLIAEQRAMASEFDELKSVNEELRRSNAQLRDVRGQVVEHVTNDLKGVVEELRGSVDAQNRSARDEVTGLLDRLQEAYQGREPEGSAIGAYLAAPEVLAGTVWVEPEGAEAGELFGAGEGPLGIGPGGREEGRQAKAPVRPVYTLAKNSTLIGLTAFTALIGRVPVGEEAKVTDPYRFKALIGRENLVANGHEIPGVAYAVVSGVAVGDWTLSCVTGDVTSLTFAFGDGRLVTIPEARDVASGGGASRQVRLGGLSDDYGNPCVLGERISNAGTRLAQAAGVMTLGAAADGIALAETTRTAGFAGQAHTVVTGDIARYAAGRGLAGTAQEVARWIRERQAQEYDVVYVAPGARVAVHVDEELRIDYDPNGRLVDYGGGADVAYRALD